GVAHDFNNLLGVVSGHLDLARATLPEGHPAEQHLSFIDDAVRNAAALTQQMLAYSGKGVFAVAPIDLSHATAEMVALLGVSIPKGVRLELSLAEGLPAIHGDRSQLQQVVMNLVTNAAEAIGGEPGTIELRTAVESIDEERIRRDFSGQELQPGSCVTLRVRDSGQGMSPEVLARIFDPFFSTKRSGRGLGLAALRGILKTHHAGIHLESQVGKGTTVLVCFPASPADLAAPAAALPQGQASEAKRTILLVDDEPSMRRTTRGLLELIGFEVLEAADGATAVEIVRQYSGRLGCVLMDLTMPGMDGHQTFLALRALDAAVPVILVSGWSEASLAARFTAHPPQGFLEKPFTVAALEAALGRVGLAPRGAA
ncbi:MAG: domain S-box protein, partial [Myxococcaceae bacterium]|nr:domain S-box protein [Myxococcaceae bacterium]